MRFSGSTQLHHLTVFTENCHRMLHFTKTENISEVVICTAILQAGFYLNMEVVWEQDMTG